MDEKPDFRRAAEHLLSSIAERGARRCDFSHTAVNQRLSFSLSPGPSPGSASPELVIQEDGNRKQHDSSSLMKEG